MKELNTFLDEIENKITLARERIIRDNQTTFVNLVKNSLRTGDKLYVANGTVLLNRGKQDSTKSESLERLIEPIKRGVWEVGFELNYITNIKE